MGGSVDGRHPYSDTPNQQSATPPQPWATTTPHAVPSPAMQPRTAPRAAGPDHRLLVIGGVAGVGVLGLILAVLAVLLLGGGSQATFKDLTQRRDSAVAKHLGAAATELSQTAGVRYTGSYTDDDGDTVEVDAELTNQGWARATLTQGKEKVAVLANHERTYLKAGKAYWSTHGAPRNTVDDYAKHWVRVPAEEVGIDLPGMLAPGALSTALHASIGRGEVTPGKTSRVDGVEVREVTVRRISYYVTVARPHQIVKIASRRSTGGTGGALTPAVAPGDPDDFEFDLSGLSPDEVKSLFTELKKRVKELKDSVDSRVTFSLSGGITLSPCTVTGCTANVTMSNSVSSTSPYLAVKKKVTARIKVEMTLDGAPVRTCAKTRTMKPNGKADVQCRATYVVPRDGRTHNVVAVATATAVATVSADIKRMFDDLKAERTQGPPNLPGKDGDLGPRWKPCDPTRIPRSTGCEKIATKIMKKIGGEQVTIKPRDGIPTLGKYRGYDTEWGHHVVVVKNGRVYDAWTSRYGEPIDVYKSRWGPDPDEVIDFGF